METKNKMILGKSDWMRVWIWNLAELSSAHLAICLSWLILVNIKSSHTRKAYFVLPIFNVIHETLEKLASTNSLTKLFHFLFSVTESLFAAGGYNTPTANAPYLPVTPLGLVAKNFHAAAASAAFSQVSTRTQSKIISKLIRNQWGKSHLQIHARYIMRWTER